MGYKKPAFSLIELMLVVVIIGILAMLVAPSITRYVARAKRAEAYMQLKSLYAAEKAYWAEHNSYSDQLLGEDGIGWSPDGYQGVSEREQFYYTYGFPGSPGINYLAGKIPSSAGYLQGAFADDTEFLAYAVADIDGDGYPDILSIDESGTISILQDDIR